MNHVWENRPLESTETDVVWICTTCSTRISFNKPGVGRPSATELAHPQNIDDYVGPCMADVRPLEINLDSVVDKALHSLTVVLTPEEQRAATWRLSQVR